MAKAHKAGDWIRDHEISLFDKQKQHEQNIYSPPSLRWKFLGKEGKNSPRFGDLLADVERLRKYREPCLFRELDVFSLGAERWEQHSVYDTHTHFVNI